MNDTFWTSIWCFWLRNWYKTAQIYTKIHVYVIFYKSCRFKQIIFSKYETNLRISGLLLLCLFNLYLAFSIDITDNIITFNPYSPYYVTGTSANHVIYVCTTWQRCCTIIGWSYSDVIQTICKNNINYIYSKRKIKIKKIIIGANLRFSGSSCGI